jgi:RHS repeat-associated protein
VDAGGGDNQGSGGDGDVDAGDGSSGDAYAALGGTLEESPFEKRASLLGRLVTKGGALVTNASFTVFDDHAGGTPRDDVMSSVAVDGSFRIRLMSFPEAEPARSPPHRLILRVDSPGTLRATREAYAHPGDGVDVGTIRLIARDPKITNIGPAGGTATDSAGLVSVVIPPGALSAMLPVQITPLMERADFPAPLPDATITMYGAELEPSGTVFATPATLRLSNFRNLPEELKLPLGTYNDAENRWEHTGVAIWNGTAFEVSIPHFSQIDANGAEAGDLVLILGHGTNPNQGQPVCGAGSAWQPTGGSVADSVALPTVRARGDDFGLTLHYDSGLAGSRRIGASSEALAAIPRGSLAVATSVSAHTECVPRGGGGAASLTPGQCASVVGSCGTGGGTMMVDVRMLGGAFRRERDTAADATEAAFGGYVEAPLADDGTIAQTGFVSSQISLSVAAASSCAANGGTFGIADAFAPRFQLPAQDVGPYASASRKVFFHHRFASPYGAGWGVSEIDRVYHQGDTAVLVSGEGREELFHPRAYLTAMPVSAAEKTFARDLRTGEIFVAATEGTISRVDPTTGVLTDVAKGLTFTQRFAETMHAFAVAYVGANRHFVLAMATRVLDLEEGGALRVLATRAPTGNRDNVYSQASVATSGSAVLYTDGDESKPIVYRLRLDDAAPALEPLSAVEGDERLFPRLPLSSVAFAAPRGLAAAADGSVYLADPRRNSVYLLRPEPSGSVGPTSVVEHVAGDGRGSYVLPAGERLPAASYPLHTPQRLSVSEDGYVLVETGYGIIQLDPTAREAELLFLHGNRDEVVASLTNTGGPTNFLALTGTSMFARTDAGYARIRVDLLASESDGTRTFTRLAGGGSELVDTGRAVVERFDAAGRLTEQRRRTGEPAFSVAYVDAQSSKIARVTDAAGGAWVFEYAGDKLKSITDPAGGVTKTTVDGHGDLTTIVTSGGESHGFVYDQHHVTAKTSPAGDVTKYSYAPDGTIAGSHKPGGEVYTFKTVDAATSTPGPGGRAVHAGFYTDAHGVLHELVVNDLGAIESDTFTADGTKYRRASVRAELLMGPDDSFVARRRNVFFRPTYTTLNDVPLSPPLTFDSLGRPVSQKRIAGGPLIHQWRYGAEGWLEQRLDGPAAASQRYDRDSAGHVLRVVDVSDPTGSLPTGRETAFTWRSDGQPATITSHGVTTTFGYDDTGATKNLLTTTDTVGRTLSLAYDARGNVTAASDGTAAASFVFDPSNRLTEVRDGLGNTTTLRYKRTECGCTDRDLVAGIHTPDLPAGVEWAMTYGPEGLLASVTDPSGKVERFTYEATGEVATVKDRLNRTTTLTHDQLGRVLSIVDKLGRAQGRSYAVPAAGAWSGPTLAAGSADGTASTTSLSGVLRSGDYQIGFNALDKEGFPAQISLYRDATFALGYTRYFDEGKRPYYRNDRSAKAIDSADVPRAAEAGPFLQERTVYETTTSAPLPTIIEAPRAGSNEPSTFSRNGEYDLLTAAGSGGGINASAAYTYTRDAAGRLTQMTTRLASPTAAALEGPSSSYTYRPDGRLAKVTNADGVHEFTYDARGLVATQSTAEGLYAYGYDGLGRSATITFPDGHIRRQVFDALGRITSRCYEYPSDNKLNRCYGAQYDAVGNPVRITSPEGDDSMEYDALDRVTKVTRQVFGGVSVTETYEFNALGALKVNAGVALDHQRPRLDGSGKADSAVPATLASQPVALDAGGRITSLKGVTFTWSQRGWLRQAAAPAPTVPEDYGVDAFLRRVWKVQGSSAEFYVYEGDDRIAIIGPDGRDPGTGFAVPGPVIETYLFAGIDHPLRMKRGKDAPVYFELDLAGNVRRLRGPNGTDLGGYRYTAFGQTVDDTATATMDQPLRWKARWYSKIAGGIYDVRARQWSPELGVFFSIDELAFHDGRSTLWGWPKQNPGRFADPKGRFAAILAAGAGFTAVDLIFSLGVTALVIDALTHDGGYRDPGVVPDYPPPPPYFPPSPGEPWGPRPNGWPPHEPWPPDRPDTWPPDQHWPPNESPPGSPADFRCIAG